MKEFQSLLKDIKNKQFLPIYFFQGEETFYMDILTDEIEKGALLEEEKGFNQTILYGKDTDFDSIISLAKQYPMGAEKQVIIVKEAQNLSTKEEDRLTFEKYLDNIQPTTLLVFNYKYKTLDGRQKLGKTLNAKKFLYASSKLYDNQIPSWIKEQTLSLGISIDEKSTFLLAEFLGTDLSKIYNELKKLHLIIGKTGKITPEVIEKHIGISKDYNNYELQKALGIKNAKKCFAICNYFHQNPKANPLVLTTTVLFNFFSTILKYHCLTDYSKVNVAKELAINPFFVSEYETSSKHYPLKKVSKAIENLRIMDLKSKGLGASGNVTQGELLREFLYQTIYM